MNRKISLSIEDIYIKYAGEAFGATGAHNALTLRMIFGSAWEGTAKTAYFTDALGSASVSIVLGLDKLVGGAYEVDVPSEALKYAGEATVTIKGVLTSGDTTTKAITTAAGHFRVLDSELPESAGNAGTITASDKEQLQAEIAGLENLFTTTKTAAETAAANAKVSETNAKASETAAASSASSAEASKTAAADSAVTAAGKATDASNSASKAASSQTAAKSSEDKAKASETAAESAKTAAEAAKAEAAESAESASASAQTAQSAASSAGAAASTASSAAAAASGSANDAAESAAAAAQSAASVAGINKTAESWAVGGTGTREGENTNNAKYWAQQAQAVAGGDFATKNELAAKVSMVITEIPKGRMRGDVDGDGKITNNDVDQIQKHNSGNITLTGADLWCADINNDNEITIADFGILRNYLKGQITVLTSTPTFADYYNNWTYHKVDNTSGYWTTELSIPAITAEMGVSITCGGSVLAGTFIKAEPFTGGVRIYANYPPIEALPCEVSYSTGAGGQIITADTDISEAQGYVADHNQSATAHSDIREAISEAGKAFVITGTLASDELGGYTVSGVTVTEAEIQAAIAAGKAVVAKLTEGGNIYELPLVYHTQSQYEFGGDLGNLGLDFGIFYTESGIESEFSTFYSADADSLASLSGNVSDQSQILGTHVNDTIRHVTAGDKTAWNAKAEKPKAVPVKIQAGGWNSSTKKQTVPVSGVSADTTSQVVWVTFLTETALDAYMEAGIVPVAQGANSVTFRADTIPTETIPVIVVIQPVTFMA